VKSVDAIYGITGPGEVVWVLGMLLEFDRSARAVAISQEAFSHYTFACLNPFDATTVTTPLVPGSHLSVADCPTSQDEIEETATRLYRGLVGALAWLALGARPDIAFATSPLACFGHNPGHVHWEAAKQVLRYLKGTRRQCLKLGGKSPGITGFINADWEAIVTTDAQSEHILSRLVMDLLAGNPRGSPVSHSHWRRRKRSTWHSVKHQRSPFGWSIS